MTLEEAEIAIASLEDRLRELEVAHQDLLLRVQTLEKFAVAAAACPRTPTGSSTTGGTRTASSRGGT